MSATGGRRTEEMCIDAGVQDPGLTELQVLGAALYGASGNSNLFDDDSHTAALDEVQLMKSSRWSRRMLLTKDHGHMDPEVKAAVWNVTLQEVDSGWLQGPYSESEVKELYGPLFVCSPRFGLVQSDKVRPIDDMSISMVNSAFAPQYKLALEGVDGIAVMARTFAEAVDDDGHVCVNLATGDVLRGVLQLVTSAGARSI